MPTNNKHHKEAEARATVAKQRRSGNSSPPAQSGPSAPAPALIMAPPQVPKPTTVTVTAQAPVHSGRLVLEQMRGRPRRQAPAQSDPTTTQFRRRSNLACPRASRRSNPACPRASRRSNPACPRASRRSNPACPRASRRGNPACHSNRQVQGPPLLVQGRPRILVQGRPRILVQGRPRIPAAGATSQGIPQSTLVRARTVPRPVRYLLP